MALPRIILKGCPRCKRGDLSLEGITRGKERIVVEYQCVQCSHVVRRKARQVGQEEVKRAGLTPV